jgi:hypothetical protein
MNMDIADTTVQAGFFTALVETVQSAFLIETPIFGKAYVEMMMFLNERELRAA